MVEGEELKKSRRAFYLRGSVTGWTRRRKHERSVRWESIVMIPGPMSICCKRGPDNVSFALPGSDCRVWPTATEATKQHLGFLHR